MVYASPASGLTRAGKYKFGARVGKYKLGARTVKYKLGAGAGKYKLGARASKHKFRARAGKYKSGARAEGREIQILVFLFESYLSGNFPTTRWFQKVNIVENEIVRTRSYSSYFLTYVK